MKPVLTEVTMSKSIRVLIETEILSGVDEWYEECAPRIPGLVASFGGRRLIGAGLASGVAGSARSRRLAMRYAREIGRLKCLTLSSLLAAQGFHALAPLACFAGAVVRRAVFDPALEGRVILARQVRESGVRRGAVIARRVGNGDFVLNARSLRVPNAEHARWLCLECSLPQDPPESRRRFVVVPVDAAGVSVSVQALPGERAVARVDLCGVQIPPEHLLGADSAAADAELRDSERLVAAAFYLSRCEEILGVAADCLRARSTSPSAAARAWLGAARLAQLHSEAAASAALLERAASGSSAHQVTLARYRVAELAGAVSRACALWWKDRSGRRAHPILQLCDDMTQSPLDGVTTAGLLGEVTRDIDCGLRVAPALPKGEMAPTRVHASR